MICVRKAERRDTDFIVSGNQAMALETETKVLDSERVTVGVSGLFDHPEYGFYVVAEMEGQLAAQLMITYEWATGATGFFGGFRVSTLSKNSGERDSTGICTIGSWTLPKGRWLVAYDSR